jgi:hypothetical protein
VSGHRDDELNRPEHLPTERLVEIAAECLRRWAAYPTIPGSLRWERNGLLALRELAKRVP